MSRPLILVSLLFALPAQSLAAPIIYDGDLYDGAVAADRCSTPHSATPFADAEVINVYIEADWAAERNDCTRYLPGLTMDAVEGVLQEAAEVWNREASGRVFRYRGTVDVDYPMSQSCDALALQVEEPALIVFFSEGCGVTSDGTCSPAAASMGPLSSVVDGGRCDTLGAGHQFGRIEVRSSAKEVGACTQSGVIKPENQLWRLRDETPGPMNGDSSALFFASAPDPANLDSVLIHELGHAQGLGHSHEAACVAAGAGSECTHASAYAALRSGAPPSVMAYGPWRDAHLADHPERGETERELRRHLWPWDRDCAASVPDFDGRSLTALWSVYDPSPNQFDLDQVSGFIDTSVGFSSGGRLRDLADQPVFGVFEDYEGGPTWTERYVWQAAVDDDGALDASTFSAASRVPRLHQAPTLSTIEERSTTSNGARVSFHAQPTATSESAILSADPPQLRYTRGNLDGTQRGPYDYKTCSEPGDVCALETLRSHVPLSQAWDPASGETIFVSVRTRDCGGAPCGYPTVHMGLRPGYNNRLRAGSSTWLLSGNVPPLPGAYDYTLTTEVGTAVTCGDEALTGFYNCLLAWVDAGSPTGDVLYTWFRAVDGQYQVLFDGSVRVLEGARSVNDLSAAFFDYRFWITWKSADPDSAGQVMHARKSGWTQRWLPFGQVTTLSAQTVDAPTWLYDPTNNAAEAALVWTELR